MAKVDITGLLTGLAGTPDLEREGIKRASAIQGQGLGSNLARSLALQAPQREQMMRQGAGGLFGVDTRTAGQQVQEQLGQLDITKPAGQEQAVQLVAQIDPTRALALRTRFAEENKALQTATAASESNVDSRANVASQLTATHPMLATAIMKEAASGNDKILVAGLKILEEKSKAVKPVAGKPMNLVDTATSKTVGSGMWRDNQFYPTGSDVAMTAAEMEGMGLSASVVQPAKPLVRVGDDPVAKRREANLTAQGEQMVVTPEDAAAAIDLAANNRRVLAKVASGMDTGMASEFLGEQAQNVQSVFQAAGLPVPQFIAGKAWNRAELTAMQNEAMIPFIAMQGKGWTDADRVNYYKTSAGFTQPWQYNEAVATMKLQSAIDTIDRSQFLTTRGQLDELTDLNSTTLWNDYLKQVPRTTVDKDFERNGLKYDRTRVVEDNSNLSQYWVEDKPTGFKLKLPSGEVASLSWADIKASAGAKGQSVRKFLAERDEAGSIVGANY